MDELERELLDLLAADRKIEAIKLLRERFHLGLADAKAAVESIDEGATLADLGLSEAGESVGHTDHASETMAADAPIPPDIRAVAEGGDPIGAIRMLRDRFGLGLHDAKTLLERHVQWQRRGCLGTMAIAIAVGLTALLSR